MLSQCLLVSINEKVISYSLFLGQQTLIALQIQNFDQSIWIYLQTNSNFFDSKLSIIMPKNYKSDKEYLDKFWSDNRFLNWKKLNYSLKI